MRNFPDFLDAYMDYAFDKFCPHTYHQWTALSLISGALERKVWINEGKITHYPNTFILLVGAPGVGKSTAITRGAAIIEKLKEENHRFKIFSGLMTQAGLCTEMNVLNSFEYNRVPIRYSSGYYYASEASDSGLQNLSGDFNATVTAMYDCADNYRKRLKAEDYNIPNPSLSLIAGSTFDFLKTLVNQNSVMGGLASRFVYVVSKERKLQSPLWGTETLKEDEITKKKLAEDLIKINQMVGPFTMQPVVLDIYNGWWETFAESYAKLNSEKIQSISTRKPTLLKKVCMLLSASERDDRVITETHITKAIGYVERVTNDNAFIISSAMMAGKTTQDATSQFILNTIGKKGDQIHTQELKRKFVSFGGDLVKYNPTLQMMWGAGMIEMPGDYVKLLVEPSESF